MRNRTYCNIHTESFEMRLSGSGGQGLISAGVLLAEAIGLGDGKNVVQAQSYGPEARGGATRCDVIVSDSEIYFPECTSYDILLCLTQEAYDKYSGNLKPDGILIIDEDDVESLTRANAIKVPFIRTAAEQFGASIVANVISLGFISEYTGIVSNSSLKNAVAERFSGTRHLDLNLKAVELGFKLGKKMKKKKQS